MSDTKTTPAPASPWHAMPNGVHATGLEGILKLRRTPPLGHETFAELIPELQQTVDKLKASPPAVRYSQLLAEITEAEKQSDQLKAKASAAAIKLADVAMVESGDVLVEAQVARDAAMSEWKDSAATVETLREAAQSLRDVLSRQFAVAQDQLRSQIGGEVFAGRKAIADQAAALIGPLLDKLARLSARFDRGQMVQLPGVDSLLGTIPTAPDDSDQPADFIHHDAARGVGIRTTTPVANREPLPRVAIDESQPERLEPAGV